MVNSKNNREKECALKKLMAYDFMQNELNLFLDTHPNNKQALRKFNEISQKALALRKEYEKNFGALTVNSVDSTEEWTWINSPWPWEN